MLYRERRLTVVFVNANNDDKATWILFDADDIPDMQGKAYRTGLDSLHTTTFLPFDIDRSRLLQPYTTKHFPSSYSAQHWSTFDFKTINADDLHIPVWPSPQATAQKKNAKVEQRGLSQFLALVSHTPTYTRNYLKD